MARKSLATVVVGISLVAAACASTTDGDPTTLAPPAEASQTTPTAVTTASVAATTTSEAPATSEASTVTAAPSPEVSFPDEWVLTEVARGVKPDLALDSHDQPAIAYLLEDREGFIAYASSTDDWAEEHVAEGYFYGPIGLAFDQDDSPVIVYHDHQDVEFNLDLGDLIGATRSATGWRTIPSRDDGHDGWDSTVGVAPDGAVHALGIDPQQFDSEDGVEHYALQGTRWQVTAIGSGPIEYEWNVSLAFTPVGNPALTYFDNNTQDLRYAERVEGIWSIETVVASGDVGRFSSLSIDDEGTPHISFYEMTGENTGFVTYATRSEGAWVTEQVAELDEVVIAFTGARRITSLDLHPNGAPVIAYSDQSGVYLATRDQSGWSTATLATSDDFAPGQLVDLEIGSEGRPHLATYAVTNESPLDGTVIYLTPTG